MDDNSTTSQNEHPCDSDQGNPPPRVGTIKSAPLTGLSLTMGRSGLRIRISAESGFRCLHAEDADGMDCGGT